MIADVEHIVHDLDESGRRLLNELIKHFINIKPKDPRTFIGYKTLHEALGLSYSGDTFGTNLQKQGLNSLAEWTYRNRLPAITGIIIDKQKLSPGKGYFELFRKSSEDYAWWFQEVEKSKNFDWSPYLGGTTEQAHIDGTSEGWSEDELRATVESYLEMLRKEGGQLPFVKKYYYEKLAAEFGRSAKAFEYRMQNISYVLSLMGLSWIFGLKPAKNVGKKNAVRIEKIVLELVKTQQAPSVAFEMDVRDVLHRKSLAKPDGSITPNTSLSQVPHFSRDARVKAWVLQQANGVCECCGSPAPFHNTDGDPFLELHHVRKLAEGGSDTVGNAVAVCPNCHRAMHYGINANELVGRLYVKVARLIKE